MNTFERLEPFFRHFIFPSYALKIVVSYYFSLTEVVIPIRMSIALIFVRRFISFYLSFSCFFFHSKSIRLLETFMRLTCCIFFSIPICSQPYIFPVIFPFPPSSQKLSIHLIYILPLPIFLSLDLTRSLSSSPADPLATFLKNGHYLLMFVLFLLSCCLYSHGFQGVFAY